MSLTGETIVNPTLAAEAATVSAEAVNANITEVADLVKGFAVETPKSPVGGTLAFEMSFGDPADPTKLEVHSIVGLPTEPHMVRPVGGKKGDPLVVSKKQEVVEFNGKKCVVSIGSSHLVMGRAPEDPKNPTAEREISVHGLKPGQVFDAKSPALSKKFDFGATTGSTGTKVANEVIFKVVPLVDGASKVFNVGELELKVTHERPEEGHERLARIKDAGDMAAELALKGLLDPSLMPASKIDAWLTKRDAVKATLKLANKDDRKIYKTGLESAEYAAKKDLNSKKTELKEVVKSFKGQELQTKIYDERQRLEGLKLVEIANRRAAGEDISTRRERREVRYTRRTAKVSMRQLAVDRIKEATKVLNDQGQAYGAARNARRDTRIWGQDSRRSNRREARDAVKAMSADEINRTVSNMATVEERDKAIAKMNNLKARPIKHAFRTLTNIPA